MYCLPLVIKTCSPVIVPVTLGEVNVVQTGEHITGSVILGMFAAEYICLVKSNCEKQDNFHEDKDFTNWFLNETLLFAPAHPVDQAGDGPYSPAPLYLQYDKADENALYNLMECAPDDTVPLGGYTLVHGSEVKKLAPRKKLNFHHRRDDRIGGRSKDGQIFNYEAIDSGQVFRGGILGPEDELRRFQKIFGEEFTGKVGRSKNTQYGRVQVKLEKVVPVDILSDLHRGLTDLKEAGLEQNHVVLTLISPAILLNRWGFPDVSLENFCNYLSKALETILEVKKAMARAETVENFVSVWRLKKPLDRALSAGASFKITFPNKLDEKILRKLASLWERGIGERTREGFGRFTVTIRFPEEYRRATIMKEDPSRPEEQMPLQVSELVNSLTKKLVLYQAETFAIADARAFLRSSKDRLPSNSLLGRLELMVKGVEEVEEDLFVSAFSQLFKCLRETAEVQLKRCWRNGINLYEQLAYFEKQKELLSDILSNLNFSKEFRELGEITGYDFNDDTTFKARLLKTYWLTLFRRMRKLNREVKQND